MRGTLWFLLAVCVVAVTCAGPLPAQQDSTLPYGPTTLNANGQCADVGSAYQIAGTYAAQITVTGSGSWTGTPEISIDGSSYSASPNASPATLTAAGTIDVAPQAIKGFKFCLTAYSSGSATVFVSLHLIGQSQQYQGRPFAVTFSIPPTVVISGAPTVQPSCAAVNYPCGLPTPIPTPSGGTYPVSGTVSNNCISNCTPTPTTPQFVHPDGTPFPISGSVTALVSPSPFATFSPYPAGAVVLTGPSTAPAASAGAYVVCVDSSGKLCVQTPAPAATGAHGGVVIEGVASGTAVTISGAVTCPTCPTVAPTGNQTVHNDGTFAGATAVPGTTPIPYPTGAGGTLVAAHTRGNSIILTSSSAHSCTSLAVGAFPLVVIDNVGAGTTVFPQFFDEAGSPTCAAADTIFGDGSTITLGPAQIISLFQGVKNGIAYSASGALSSNLVVGW